MKPRQRLERRLKSQHFSLTEGVQIRLVGRRAREESALLHLPQYHPDSRVERRNHQKDNVKKVIPPAGMSSQAVPAPQEK